MPNRCSVCRQPGHTAATCTHPDAQEKRARSSSKGNVKKIQEIEEVDVTAAPVVVSEPVGLPLLLSSANEVERLASAVEATNEAPPSEHPQVQEEAPAVQFEVPVMPEEVPVQAASGEQEFVRPEIRKRRRSNNPDLPPNGIAVPMAKRRFDEQRYRMPSEGDTIQGWNHWPARIERASTSSRRCKNCYNIRNVERKTTFFCIGCDVYLCVPHANSNEPNCFKDYHSTLLQYYYSCLVGAQEAAALESRLDVTMSDGTTTAEGGEGSGSGGSGEGAISEQTGQEHADVAAE